VLLREANDQFGLPVSVFRCDMKSLADTTLRRTAQPARHVHPHDAQPVATGVAPTSFYELGADGQRQRAHYDGLPVEFIADASRRGTHLIETDTTAFQTIT